MKKRTSNLGCIDPHGMYPFPKDRESCPKCQAIRAAKKPGLRYGWWKVWVSFDLRRKPLFVLPEDAHRIEGNS